MGAEIIRIFSDVHYGERASRVRALAQLEPLFAGASRLVVNGDLLDTRDGPHPERVAENLRRVREFLAATAPPATLISGNHDPNISSSHSLDLAGGRILATHGDILFDSIVPWSREAPALRRKLFAAFASEPGPARLSLEERLRIFRSVAAALPQRGQAETNPLKYGLWYASETLWPPHRALRILRAWRDAPDLAANLTRRHRPAARFILIGHTHRPGVWRRPDGLQVINTGSFCRPLGGIVAELTEGSLVVRRIRERNGEFRLAEKFAEFELS